MAKIIWLASYPKSGNTWMRLLLANYLRDADAPVDINRLGLAPIASARACFDDWVGVEASVLAADLIEELRPEVFRCMLREAPDPLYMKVHDAWRRTRTGSPLFPSDITAGVVYLIRNPLDVAVSCAHHWGVSVEQAAANLCNPEFGTSRSGEGLADQLYQRLFCWSGHVRSWIDDSGLPVHLVRFEDLCCDPEEVFGGVVGFCGLPWDAGRVRKAVAFSDFSELQRQEQRHGFRERPLHAVGAFFRSGSAGSWRDGLSPALAAQLMQVHGESMRRFGYPDETRLLENRTYRKGVAGDATGTEHPSCAFL